MTPHGLQLVVLTLNLFFAVLFQDLMPVSSWMPVKIGFLTAVSLYAALVKPAPIAMVTALVAGGMHDALGGLPMCCTSCFLLAMVGLTRLLKQFFLEATVLHGIAYCGAVMVLQGIWTRLWPEVNEPLTFAQSLVRWVYLFPAGMIAGGVGFAWCGLADRLAGLVKPVEEGDGIFWSEIDR